MRSQSHFSMQIFCTQRRVDQAVVNTEETLPKITGASEDSRCNAISKRYGPCSTVHSFLCVPCPKHFSLSGIAFAAPSGPGRSCRNEAWISLSRGLWHLAVTTDPLGKFHGQVALHLLPPRQVHPGPLWRGLGQLARHWLCLCWYDEPLCGQG